MAFLVREERGRTGDEATAGTPFLPKILQQELSGGEGKLTEELNIWTCFCL